MDERGGESGEYYSTEDTPDTIQQLMSENETYPVTLCGGEFKVCPGVFSPKYFGDTEYYAQAIPKQFDDLSGINFLEIGPGAGILPVLMAEKGAHVTGIDINKKAVNNSIINVVEHGVQANVRILYGDIYSPLTADEKFDVVYWNLPFGYTEGKELSDIEKACFDNEYQATAEFFRGAREHLSPDGRIMYGFSTTYGNNEALGRILEDCGLESKLISVMETEAQGKPVKYELFEAVPKGEK